VVAVALAVEVLMLLDLHKVPTEILVLVVQDELVLLLALIIFGQLEVVVQVGVNPEHQAAVEAVAEEAMLD
jgi:hypothetical protein